MFHDGNGIEAELNDALGDKVVRHRAEHYRIMESVLFQTLIATISYKNIESIQVDPHRLETLLRLGYDVAIGMTKLNTCVILGWSKHKPVGYDIEDYYTDRNDIIFRIPKSLMLDEYSLITELDDCKTGNYIVVSNQYYFNNSDLHIIRHYCKKLAELEASRFSLCIQAKCMTWFKFDSDDESANVAIQKMYDGHPTAKIAETFDEDSIGIFENASVISQQLTSCKQEYNSTFAEFCQTQGINSLGIAKESGTSRQEVEANNELAAASANIKIKSRQEPFNRLNKRFGFNIEVLYDNSKNPEEFPILHQAQKAVVKEE